MKIHMKILAVIVIIVAIIFENNCYFAATTNTALPSRAPIRIGLFSKNLNDDYLIALRQNFENIQKKTKEKLYLIFTMPILISQHKIQILIMHLMMVLILYY